MTRFYHPFGASNFVRSLVRIIWLVITGQRGMLARIMKSAPQIATDENKARSLAGIYILFIALFIQAVGALFVLIDLFVN
jgi:hypothetical protein